MNDYLSVRGTRDFARVSPEELNRVQIARNGYHLKNRGTNAQLGALISRYLCDGLKSRCWDCECLVQCEYGKRYMALLRQREADAGRPWMGYKAALKPELDAYRIKVAEWHRRQSAKNKGNQNAKGKRRKTYAEDHG